MRFSCFCLLLVAMLPLGGVAQEQGTGQQGSNSYDLWLVRSQAITADLIKDSTDLGPSERALLLARLAQSWWRNDPEQARGWLLKPIEIVEATPNKENPAERRQRLSLARELLKIIAPLDRKLSERLVVILKQNFERDAQGERASNADGLVEAATYLVDSDPKRASELGVLALRVGPPTNLASLLWKLRAKDLHLADVLFSQALAKARETLDGALLGSLVSWVFPEYYTPGFSPGRLVTTDEMRREILRAYVVYLQANKSDAENRDYPCARVISIAPVLAELERLLPQQATIVRQSVNQCQAIGPLTQQILDDAVRDQPLNTVADLLKAGDEAQDMKVRTVYQFRAAMLAKQKNELERALKILDSMSTESREFMDGSWEAYRWDWAATAALRRLKIGDVYGMRLIINAVPTDLQPAVKIAFVRQLPDDRDKDTDPTLEFLSDARTGLRRSSVSDEVKSVGYFALLPLAIKYQPAEATAVLKEAIGALNRAEQAKEKNTSASDGRGLAGSEFSKLFPASLLEMDEYAVKEAVSSITSPDLRVQVRLGLLSVCLERLRSAKQVRPKPEQAASKGA